MEGTLSSRDKNDIFWIKQRRYIASSVVKEKAERGYFNPDMAAEVKSAYERYDKRAALYELTGNEFMDHPPVASGQIAFAKSIAMMMHTLDRIDYTLSSEPDQHDIAAPFFKDIVTEAGLLIRETIDAFFMGCGVDSEGNEYKDRRKKKAAQALFYEKRKEYEMLIKNERRIAGWEMIDIIRESNGIDELIETDEKGEDQEFLTLIRENESAAADHKEEIEALSEVSRRAMIEAASLLEGRKAMLLPVKKRLEDGTLTEGLRRLLRDAYDGYLFDVDMRLRELTFICEAAYYMARWLLLKEPVDEILANRIALISEEKPAVIEGGTKLSELQGYKPPKEELCQTPVEYDDPDALFAMGNRVRQYLYTHPYQFEAQCLLSIIRDLDTLTEILPVSWELMQAIDALTASGKFAAYAEEVRQQIFDIWVISEMVCTIGYSITETVVEDPEKTVKEACDTLRSMAQKLSYYSEEKRVRKTLAQIVMERSGVIVY